MSVAKAIRKTFGRHTLIQRCQIHKALCGRLFSKQESSACWMFFVERVLLRRMVGPASGQLRPYVRPVCAACAAGHHGCTPACQAPIRKACSEARMLVRYELPPIFLDTDLS